MSVLSTAAIIGLTAAAGASAAGAAIQAHQTGKAVDAQTDAGNKALALQQQQYQQARTDAAPYQQVGQSTLGRLGQMAAQPQAQFNPANYSHGVPVAPQASAGQQGPSGWPGGVGAISGVIGGTTAAGQAGPMPGPQQIAAGQQGDTVTIQTPDGRTLQGFPRAKVQEAMQRGARVVG